MDALQTSMWVKPARGQVGKEGANPDCLWDARDVARYLKASRSWVYQRAEAGLLPSLRMGGLLRFEPEAVRAWARGAPVVAAARPLDRSVASRHKRED